MRAPDPRIILGLHRSRYERRLLTAALDLGVSALDTSFNYRGFTAHTTLAGVVGDLLSRFTISTKVGFFPGPGPRTAQHSLVPARLRAAVEQTNRDLRRAPDLVFLHNPERALHDAAPQGRDLLAEACGALEEATARGLCGGWGIASWTPHCLPALVDGAAPRPSVLMVRAGLLAGIATLDAADALARQWNLSRDAVWGMSPFGGNTHDPVWEAVDPRMFLNGPTDDISRFAAAFRAAFSLPRTGAVAVGTDRPAHVRELVNVLRCEPDEEKLLRYGQLLRERAERQPV